MAEKNKAPIKRKKRRKKSGLGYILLFALVFLSALYGLSYLVKSYSPDVDVEIGNNETLTFNDTDIEIKTVDERLKWIQMEDELPTVSIKTSKDNSKKNEVRESKSENDSFIKKREFFLKKRKKDESDIEKETQKTEQKLDFRLKPPIENATVVRTPVSVVEKPKEVKITKVYVGQYSTVEEAIKMQNKIAGEAPDTIPFIKSINGKYVVQIGSFSDKEKALALVTLMNDKGYNARAVSTK